MGSRTTTAMRSARLIVMAMGALLIALFVITASPPAHAADATPTPGATAGEVQTEPLPVTFNVPVAPVTAPMLVLVVVTWLPLSTLATPTAPLAS
ncbi:MAG: hypothetical protein J0J00_05750, partial [Microbacterium sp.]|nr:hypothetical protein [Microbacterium sp.]